MKFLVRLVALVFVVTLQTACSSDESSLPLEPVVIAYDTVEYRYQQVSDLAIDLMANISMDPSIKVKPVQDLLDREPVVSLDFRNTKATQRDITRFISYQHEIEIALQSVFAQLEKAPKWREAPLILDIRNKYSMLNDSITIAEKMFNQAAKDASLQLTIPAVPSSLH
ncbi:MAG: hypothetical protein EOO01_10390 [Chitinophagaceae bacterium]|nr:MAG: hypothetical protein EOO01_10390 [Chitinophagaceae bacterium]